MANNTWGQALLLVSQMEDPPPQLRFLPLTKITLCKLHLQATILQNLVCWCHLYRWIKLVFTFNLMLVIIIIVDQHLMNLMVNQSLNLKFKIRAVYHYFYLINNVNTILVALVLVELMKNNLCKELGQRSLICRANWNKWVNVIEKI